MEEKKNQQPAKNLQMMRFKLREDDPSVNIVTQSGVAIGDDKPEVKKLVVDARVRKAG